MSPLRNIMLAVCLAVAFGAASDPTFPAPKQPNAYIPDKEMSFEMNSSTGFVRVPLEYNWVKKYSLGADNIAMPAGRVSIGDRAYLFEMNDEELRKLCGNGARRLPIKARITDRRTKKQKPYHITRLMVNYRNNGHADVRVEGYIFEK